MTLLAEVSGGPLEGRSDASPREMAVTGSSDPVQNPAYRPTRSPLPPYASRPAPSGVNRYPIPDSVRRYRGAAVSRSSFFRSCATYSLR